MKILIFLVLGLPFSTQAMLGFGPIGSEPFDCNVYLDQVSQMSGAIQQSQQPMFKFENGEIKVDRRAKGFKSYEKKGNSDIVEYEVPEYNHRGQTGKKVRVKFIYEKSGDGFKIRHDFDDASAKRSWEEMQKIMREGKFGFGMGGFGMGGFGPTTESETKILKVAGSNQCEVDQSSSTSIDHTGQGKITTVFQDKKFCDSIKNQLKSLGKENFEKCERNMTAISELISKRANELTGEKKVLFANGLNAFSITGVSWGLRSCAPAEWAQFSNPNLAGVPLEHIWNTSGKLDAAEAAQQQLNTVPGGGRR